MHRKTRTRKKKKGSKKPILVLDLDNTLLSSIETSRVDSVNKRRKQIPNSQFRHTDAFGIYRIYHRPYLQEFLDYAVSHFQVIIWTAGTEEYAKFIVKNILTPRLGYETPYICIRKRKDRSFPLLYSHDDCLKSQIQFRTKALKDLRYLSHLHPEYTLDQMMILICLKIIRMETKALC